MPPGVLSGVSGHHIYDTPTPPSQSYATINNNSKQDNNVPNPLLQTSLRPLSNSFQAQYMSTALPKSRLGQQQVKMAINNNNNLDFDDTFSSASSDPGQLDNNNMNNVRKAATVGNRYENDENLNSLGYGDAVMGMTADDKDRFLDLHKAGTGQRHRNRAKISSNDNRRATRVDDFSDASSNDTGSSSEDGDDEFVSRLANNNPSARPGTTSTPFHPSSNISKSAFDGMARELRKEFERILEVGNQNKQQNILDLEPSQQRYTQANPSSNTITASSATATSSDPLSSVGITLPTARANPPNLSTLPRGVPPKRSPARPAAERRDSTPTGVRVFGQTLPSYHQGYTRPATQPPTSAVPISNFEGPPSGQSQPPKSQYREPYHALSPFHISAAPPAGSGLVPPNNTRATSASPRLQHRVESFSPPSNPIRASSFPSPHTSLHVPDVTGLTEGLTSPSKVVSGSSHRPIASSSESPRLKGRSFAPSVEDPALSSALATLRKRLEALEDENFKSETKVIELENELRATKKANGQFNHMHSAHRGGAASNNTKEHDGLISALKTEIDRLQRSIVRHSRALNDLQASSGPHQQAIHAQPTDYNGYRQQTSAWTAEYLSLKQALNELTEQVIEVKKILEEILQNVHQYPPHHPRDQDLLRPEAYSARGAQRHEASSGMTRQQSAPDYYYAPTYNGPIYNVQRQQQDRPSSAPPANVAYRVQRQQDPISFHAQQQEPLLDRAERILQTLPPKIDSHLSGDTNCEVCRKRAATHEQLAHARGTLDGAYMPEASFATRESQRQQLNRTREEIPMQTVISRALRDLEDDFAVHKKIYIELSDEYKLMDPASPDVGKRKILASHLKESIDVLEAKADEIKRLYDLLHYRGELQQTMDVLRLREAAQNLRTRYA